MIRLDIICAGDRDNGNDIRSHLSQLETGDTGWDVVLYFKSLAPIRSIISRDDTIQALCYVFSLFL